MVCPKVVFSLQPRNIAGFALKTGVPCNTQGSCALPCWAGVARRPEVDSQVKKGGLEEF